MVSNLIANVAAEICAMWFYVEALRRNILVLNGRLELGSAAEVA